MLQTQSIYPDTLELLKNLMSFQPLSNFNLVGGTALALQVGHRISVDLDLFTNIKFDIESLKKAIESFAFEKKYEIKWNTIEQNTLIGLMNSIKIDIIYYPYNLIDELIVYDNIRLLSTKDIAPMKLSAIAQRGKKKDFFDFYELLQIYSLEEMLQFYREKIPYTDTTFLLRSLTYFEDAEVDLDPIMIKKYNWVEVKNIIKKSVNQYINSKT